MNGIDDGHFDILSSGELSRALCRRDPFSDRLATREYLAERCASPDFQSYGSIATERSRARQHEITDARQSRNPWLVSMMRE